MPMLALVCRRSSSITNGSTRAALTRSAIWTAASSDTSVVSRRANSSPPSRAITSAPPHDLLEPVGQLDQQPVADVVAEGVVDLLELVEVHHEQGHRLAAPGGLAQRLAEPVLEQGPVGQAGQPVVEGLAAQRLRGQRRGGHVAEADPDELVAQREGPAGEDLLGRQAAAHHDLVDLERTGRAGPRRPGGRGGRSRRGWGAPRGGPVRRTGRAAGRWRRRRPGWPPRARARARRPRRTAARRPGRCRSSRRCRRTGGPAARSACAR